MSSGSGRLLRFCSSTGGTSCQVCRWLWPRACWGSPGQRSSHGGRQAFSFQLLRGAAAMRSPSTASSACKFSLRNSGGSERAVNSGITCGGPLKTLPTTPTASLPRRCASCAPENSATSTCLHRKTLTGHAVNSLIQARGSEADRHDCSYAAGPRADRVTARQSQGGAHISRRGHTPARMRGRGCTAGRRRALGRLQAGSVRRVASPDCFRGTGSVHPAARRRAHAHSQPLPAAVYSAGHHRAGGAPHQAAML